MSSVTTKRVAGIRASALGFLLAALMVLLPPAVAPVRADATFTVNNVGDIADLDPGDGVCNVSLFTGDQCTLRAAIQEANATAGADTINFNVSGGGVKTISPNTPLPEIADEVSINGYSQPGADENTLANGSDANLLIELNGEDAGPGSSGLTIGAPDSVVKGLVINRFSGAGILVTGDDNEIKGNFIGTDPLGNTNLGNSGVGVSVFASGNTVGGASPEVRNLISGNDNAGVFIGFQATGNTVRGNYIGTTRDGTGVLGNFLSGVGILAGSDNTIGGASSGAANTIAFTEGDSLNRGNGVDITGDGTGNRILGNSIFSNDDLGIDLGRDGPTPNDKKDRDTGPNDLQNFPVLNSAKTSGGKTTIKG
ncbi:MAG: CSLREA domain-containing protein, partial [Rubrobacteraceae bacterium]